jgi:LysM repeat protein
MFPEGLLTRSKLGLVIVLAAFGLVACYKNAGENVEPTSNRVDVDDLQPTATMPPLTATFTSAPASPTQAVTQPVPATEAVPATASPAGATATVRPTLAPTITPAGGGAQAGSPTPTTAAPHIAPSFTPGDDAVQAESATPTPAQPAITTPGMSDIQPSATQAPTIDPAMQPTPTAIPAEENPCVHVVQGGDTLYSIAQENGVGVDEMVAANPSLLGGSALTPLQIGWQLQIPGCATPEPDVQPTVSGEEPIIDISGGEEPIDSQPTPATGQTVHVVQAGDTVYSIAASYGITVDDIVAANNLITQGNVVYISVGQELVIPTGQ